MRQQTRCLKDYEGAVVACSDVIKKLIQHEHEHAPSRLYGYWNSGESVFAIADDAAVEDGPEERAWYEWFSEVLDENRGFAAGNGYPVAPSASTDFEGYRLHRLRRRDLKFSGSTVRRRRT